MTTTQDTPRLREGAMVAEDVTKARDKKYEGALRPERFGDFVGQARIKENLQVYIRAANGRGETLDHVLLSGPPGLGKTTLANIIAREMGATMRTTSGPAVKIPGDLVGVLTNLKEGDVLFIDEIHRLPPVVEEYLYSAMEDFTVDVIIDQGPAARTLRFDLRPFTVIGATTREGMLTRPLRERFGIPCRLDFYEVDEVEQVVVRSAELLKVEIDGVGAREIAVRSRRTPRTANHLLRRARDWAQDQGDGVIDGAIARLALEKESVDEAGLREIDRHVLRVLLDNGGGPVGLKTIAAAVSEEEDTIENEHEPYLIREGYILKTPRGRVATRKAYEHMGRKAPKRRRELEQQELFED